MQAAIMEAPMLDVRDMQCAQALAQASQAMRRLAPGGVLDVTCNAEDVARDLVAWARQLRYAVTGPETRDGETWLTIRKNT